MELQPTISSGQLELTNNVKWGTIIPLIGGSSIGCARSAGNLPAFHLTYTPFKNNETHLMRYWPKVPKYYIDKDQEPENMQGVDYINGVCPCAGLSMLNTSRTSGISRGSDAEMTKWMFQSAESVLGRIKPKVFWGENAPGLFTTIGQGVVDGLRKLGEAHGYSFSLMKTNTELHGIPQKRIRTFYFFWNTPTVPELTYKYKKPKSFSNYLKEIPKSATQQDMFLTKGKASERFRPYQFVLLKEGLTHRQFRNKYKKNGTAFTISQYLERNDLEEECMSWLMVHYPDEGMAEKKSNSRTHIEYIQHCRNKKAMGKGYWDDSPRFFGDSFGALMSKTMFTAVHPDEDRFLNIREMMHLMGLPHDFEINNVKNFNHIAQNVPVHTAKDWADEVKLFCEGKLPMTDYSFIKQDNISQCIVANDGFHSDSDYEPFPKIKRTNKEQEPMVVKQEAMDVKQEPSLVKQEPSIVKQEPRIEKQEPSSSSDWLSTTESSIKTQNNTAQNNALGSGFLKQDPIVMKQEPLGINTQTYMKPHWSAQVTEPQIKQTNINQEPISAQFSIDPWGPKPQIKQTNLKQEPSLVKQEPLGISAKGYKIAYHTASGVAFQVKHPEVQIKQTNTDQDSVFFNKQPVEVKRELDMPLLEPSPSSSKRNEDIYLKDQEPGFVKQEPGFVKQEPGFVKQKSGFVKLQPGFVKQDTRFVKQEPGFVKQEPGFVKQEPGFVKQEPGSVKQELGFVKKEPGFVKQEPVEMNVPLYLDPRSNSRNEVIENVMAGLPMGKVVSFSFNDAFSKFLHKN
jgi:site-specific DNA-cytosine methylase